MPIVDIEENIKQMHTKIEQMTQEIFRMQGMLAAFEGFKKGGLKTIDLPNDPNQEPVEKPVYQVTPEDMVKPPGIPVDMPESSGSMDVLGIASQFMGMGNAHTEELKSTQEKPE